MKILNRAAGVVSAKLDVEAAELLADLLKLSLATPRRVSPILASGCLQDVRDLGTNEQLWQAILLVDDFFKGFPYRMDSLLPLRELSADVDKMLARAVERG